MRVSIERISIDLRNLKGNGNAAGLNVLSIVVNKSAFTLVSRELLQLRPRGTTAQSGSHLRVDKDHETH